MKKEIFLGLTILGISSFAFSRQERREVGERAHWQCQWPGCTRTFKGGYMTEVNHEIPLGKGGTDDTSKAKLYCQEHHALWHEKRGETSAARAIRGRMKATGGRTDKWLSNHRKS
jgi:hypothetical protein